MLVDVDPPVYYDVPALNALTFTVTVEPPSGAPVSMFSDRAAVVSTVLHGAGAVNLAQWDLVFVFSPP